MSIIVKSFSVNNGDMFYIKHGSDNFTIIDCNLCEENRERIKNELVHASKGKTIKRFISTHPDSDHIGGLVYLDNHMPINNFYCVKNDTKKMINTPDFIRYCELRDGSKAFYIKKDCSRKWMNQNCEQRGSSGINILWPIIDNADYIEALRQAQLSQCPNNISPIITYSLNNGVKMIWMGDMETGFMENIKNHLSLSEINILFAPHHGRDSGKVPADILNVLNPDIIIIGEAPCEHLCYYRNYNTITQNTAGDITFECESNFVHIYVSNENYSVNYLLDQNKANTFGKYIGTLPV